eukprot:scaffold88626_cov27-Tisochrysis_lutea.AAC.3
MHDHRAASAGLTLPKPQPHFFASGRPTGARNGQRTAETKADPIMGPMTAASFHAYGPVEITPKMIQKQNRGPTNEPSILKNSCDMTYLDSNTALMVV